MSGWGNTEPGQAKVGATASTKPTKETLFRKPTKMRRGLKVGVFGPAKVGKTHLCLTFPPPLYIINTEPTGVIRLLCKEQFSNKDIYEFPTWESWMNLVNPSKEDIAIKSMEKMEEAIDSLYDVSEGTIILDSATHLWSWVQLYLRVKVAQMGRKSGDMVFQLDWPTAFEEYRRLFYKLLVRPCNFVCTGQEKDVYVGENNTGRKEGSWMKETPHMCDIVVHMTKNMVVIPGTNPPEFGPQFHGVITDSRFDRPLVQQKQLAVRDLDYDKLVKALTVDLKLPRNVIGLE